MLTISGKGSPVDQRFDIGTVKPDLLDQIQRMEYIRKRKGSSDSFNRILYGTAYEGSTRKSRLMPDLRVLFCRLLISLAILLHILEERV